MTNLGRMEVTLRVLLLSSTHAQETGKFRAQCIDQFAGQLALPKCRCAINGTQMRQPNDSFIVDSSSPCDSAVAPVNYSAADDLAFRLLFDVQHQRSWNLRAANFNACGATAMARVIRRDDIRKFNSVAFHMKESIGGNRWQNVYRVWRSSRQPACVADRHGGRYHFFLEWVVCGPGVRCGVQGQTRNSFRMQEKTETKQPGALMLSAMRQQLLQQCHWRRRRQQKQRQQFRPTEMTLPRRLPMTGSGRDSPDFF
jgi:hypothetical protein